MHGRSVRCRLGHGARRFPELHCRGRIARGNRRAKLPRCRPPPFAFGEGGGVRGIRMAFVSFDAAESLERILPTAVRVVRLENWLRVRRWHLERRPTAA